MQVKIEKDFSIWGLFVHDASPWYNVDVCWLEDQLNEEKMDHEGLNEWNFKCPECNGLSRFTLFDGTTTLPTRRIHTSTDAEYYFRAFVNIHRAIEKLDRVCFH